MTRPTAQIVSLLAKYTPCDVSDALVNFGSKTGGYIPNLVLRSATSSQVAGTAYTVLYVPKSDPRPAVKQSYIDEIPENSVLVISLPLSCQRASAPYVTVNNALYGGLMSTRAQYRGANGSVVLGRIRDLDEHEELGYPVWSYGVGSTAPGPVAKVVGINVPLEVQTGEELATDEANNDEKSNVVTINPGDFVVGDKNGIVVLPASSSEFVSQVVEYIPKRVEADKHVSEDIKRGKGAAESQKFWRSKI
ncbi:4-hydroxy-4-methyl-2-oxoglutarate aldolase [[Candida] anglica]